MEAKRSYIQEGNHQPTAEEIARRVGIAIDKLEKLLCFTRTPLSMQQTVWSDQNTTFQVNASLFSRVSFNNHILELQIENSRGKET